MLPSARVRSNKPPLDCPGLAMRAMAKARTGSLQFTAAHVQSGCAAQTVLRSESGERATSGC
jgi:hypothetical protein